MPQTSSTTQDMLLAQAPATQTATGQPAGTAPVTVVKQHSFATFSFGITLLLVLLFFCYFFFKVRRKEHNKHVDTKAGDEGED
jgi:heme/copper-type cytochrome/quinol oxidase subunit 2